MKPLKKAEQKNVVLNTDYYTIRDLENMWFAGEIVRLDYKQFGVFVEPREISRYEEIGDQFRIFLENVKDLKVALDDGHYTTVAVGNNGKTYYVNL